MPRLQGPVVTGAPVPCSRCRVSFRQSSVSWTKRNAMGALCPPCLKVVKAQKAAKKREKR